jgi:hypothetical protein
MPRRISTLVFDDFVVGTTAVYTSPEFNDELGRCERLAIQAITDQVTGTTPTLLVQQEHSSDQRNFSNKNGAAEIPATSISTTATTVLTGYELGTNPSHGYIRLRIQLGGTSPQAHVKIWVTGRDLL